MLRLPDEGAWISAGDVEYFIPADWLGEHDIVSRCGWWMGKVCIVQAEDGRYVEWLQAHSLNFDA